MKLEGLKTKHGDTGPAGPPSIPEDLGRPPTRRPRKILLEVRKERVRDHRRRAGRDRERKVAFVLPGVHPGPFFPVGSYNLSELIHRALRSEGVAPVVLHGTGGHERNTPTNSWLQHTQRDITIRQLVEAFGEGHDERSRLRHGRHHQHNHPGFREETSSLSSRTHPSSPTTSTQPASRMPPRPRRSSGYSLSMVDAHNSSTAKAAPRPRLPGLTGRGYSRASWLCPRSDSTWGSPAPRRWT